MEYPEVILEEVVSPDDSMRLRPLNTYKPQALRWLNAKQVANKSPVKAINKEEAFCFGFTNIL